jgi:hypothetical protein
LGRAYAETLIAVAQLDGVWDVKRTGGLLPPLVGVRKRIGETRGATTLGPLRMSFEVRGNELHYHAPFRGFVDVVDGEGDVRQGHATYRGREFGRFQLRRRPATSEA